MKKCNCDVPDDLHATCCGWVNAWVFLDDRGCINDERHPGHGQNYSQWLSQQTTPNPPRNNVEEKFNTYTDQSAYTPSYLLTDSTPSVEKSEGEEAEDKFEAAAKLRRQFRDDNELATLYNHYDEYASWIEDKYISLLHSSGDRGRKEEE